MNALILFSHGSLLCGSGEALDQHADRLRQRGNYDLVGVGYLNYSDPPFAKTLERFVSVGADRITVVPYFLAAGFFVNRDLPRLLDDAKARYPKVTFRVAEALRHDPGIAAALLEAAGQAKPAAHWRDPLARASAACASRPECPLYATPACPRVPAPEAALR